MFIMKHILSAMVISGVAIFLTNATDANAQTNANPFKTNTIVEQPVSSEPKNSGTLDESNVNIRAVRSFRKSYPSAHDAKWSETGGTYFVSFLNEGIRQKIAFQKTGEMDYSLKIFSRQQVPASILKTMKLNYYDYQVTGAQELKLGSKAILFVQLSAGKNWKTVRIEDGQIEEIQNLREQ
jgi:hypothetical protein